jgi:hypothetical protein
MSDVADTITELLSVDSTDRPNVILLSPRRYESILITGSLAILGEDRRGRQRHPLDDRPYDVRDDDRLDHGRTLLRIIRRADRRDIMLTLGEALNATQRLVTAPRDLIADRANPRVYYTWCACDLLRPTRDATRCRRCEADIPF